jgi:radical SAM family uncharacterized protein
MSTRKKYDPVVLERGDLLSVENPARYTGGEWGITMKPQVLDDIQKTGETSFIRYAFCFPDIYEIGMSNLAVRILYNILNLCPYVWCERAFSPWKDMDQLMREKGIPLFSLETKTALCDFDVLGFTLPFEMCYTNVLQMLDLSGIPLRSCDRSEDDPIITAGGPVVYNIEPMADFLDIVMIGEGEEMILEFMVEMKKYKDAKNTDHPMTRAQLLQNAARIEGVYVPSFYRVEELEDGTVHSVNPAYPGIPERIRKRVILDMDQAPYPTEPIVPNTKIVHDRAYLELFRGCIRGCRFCQAGFVYRPVRQKSASVLCEQGILLEKNSGYDELGMLSLSTSDYAELPQLTDGLLEAFDGHHTSLSLPSMRVDSFSLELTEKVSATRKSGLTFAPEAGTQRLRDVINKGITEEDILSSLEMAFEGGWNSVKLYFMIGLPTETQEDVFGIADLVRKIEKLYFEVGRRSGQRMRRLELTVSTSMFIPKPFTPFQWERQNTKEEFSQKQQILRERLRSKNIKYVWHDLDTSVWEGVIARGDRRLSPVLLDGYLKGYMFDAWDDCFSLAKWMEVLEMHGLQEDFYTTRERKTDEIFPWDHMDCGVQKEFLLRERSRAYEEKTTPSCKEHCEECGAVGFGGGVCFEST